jgi:hypothetical protein
MLRDMLRRALDSAGISPPVRFTGAAADLQAVEVASFQRGSTRLLGLARRNYGLQPDVEQASLDLPETAHIYDVRRGEYLGHGTTARVPLRSGGAALLAMLPYEVRGVQAEADTRADGINLRLRIDGAGGGDQYHIIEVRVTGPDGIERKHYRENVVLTGESVEHVVPLAPNDPRGSWQIAARDIISGQTVAIEVVLRQR